MDITDWMLWKMIGLAVLAFVVGLLGGFSGNR